MHNDMMAVGSKECPPMLAPGNYAQWSSRFMRYVDTKPNKYQLGQCIEKGPYILTQLVTAEVPAKGDNLGQLRVVREETYINTTPENRKLIDAKAEAIHMILNGIGESINKQDVKTKLFWEFGKFTSRDEESIESYYTRFYRMMNEMVRNNLKVDTMQVNVQFLQQLQPEWSRFVTIVKQHQDLDTVSFHKLFDILKQHQNKVNEIRVERIARITNLHARVAATQHYLDDYTQSPKPYKTHAHSSRQTPLTRTHATNGTKEKRLSNHIHLNLNTDEEPDKQELEAHYMYMAKIQEVLHAVDDISRPTYDDEPLEKVHTDDDYNVFANEKQHSEQPESINHTYELEKTDRNVISDSSNMYDNEGNADQNVNELEDARVFLANLKLDVDENKMKHKQLKKANTPLTQELEKSKQDLFY
nr:hypothetical protein [Tanacetum cinerariifolium]